MTRAELQTCPEYLRLAEAVKTGADQQSARREIVDWLLGEGFPDLANRWTRRRTGYVLYSLYTPKCEACGGGTILPKLPVRGSPAPRRLCSPCRDAMKAAHKLAHSS